jgi:hypothetical protein
MRNPEPQYEYLGVFTEENFGFTFNEMLKIQNELIVSLELYESPLFSREYLFRYFGK